MSELNSSENKKLILEFQQDLETLQSTIQFQEDTIQQLDKAVVDQGELIDKLTRRLILIEDKVTDLAEEGGNTKINDQEKPPHY